MLIARLGDITQGTYEHGSDCCPHFGPGVVLLGAKTVWVEGKPLARMGDKTLHSCPHCRTGMALGLSPTVWSEGKPHHHIGNPINETCGMGVQITACKRTMDASV